MKTYTVTATIEVTADDEQEAIQKVEGCMVWTGVEGVVSAQSVDCIRNDDCQDEEAA